MGIVFQCSLNLLKQRFSIVCTMLVLAFDRYNLGSCFVHAFMYRQEAARSLFHKSLAVFTKVQKITIQCMDGATSGSRTTGTRA